MAIFNLKCSECNFEHKRMLEKYTPYECPICQKGVMLRNPNFTVQVKEVIDNGLMPKRVEVYKDITTLRKRKPNDKV